MSSQWAHIHQSAPEARDAQSDSVHNQYFVFELAIQSPSSLRSDTCRASGLGDLKIAEMSSYSCVVDAAGKTTVQTRTLSDEIQGAMSEQFTLSDRFCVRRLSKITSTVMGSRRELSNANQWEEEHRRKFGAIKYKKVFRKNVCLIFCRLEIAY